jgi:hypothetical protein
MKRRNLEATTQAVGVAVDGSTEQNSRAWQSVLIQATLRMPSAQLRRSHSERKTTENPVSIDEFVSAACRTSDVEAVHVTKFQEKNIINSGTDRVGPCPILSCRRVYRQVSVSETLFFASDCNRKASIQQLLQNKFSGHGSPSPWRGS